MANQKQMEDVWRHQNEGVRDYTYYSASKRSWTRIDMIWATRSMLTFIRKIDILPKILSDNNPMVLTLKAKRKMYKRSLNEELLEKKENMEYIQKEVYVF